MRDRPLFVLVGVTLALLTIVEFDDLARNDFIGCDDTGYLTKNPMVCRGLSLPGAIWAFTTTHRTKGLLKEAVTAFHGALELDPGPETAPEGLRALGSPGR